MVECNSKLKHQSVVGIVETRGEFLLLDGIKADLVAHVNEVGRYVSEASAELDGVLHGLMRFVRCVTQGSDNEQLDASEQRQRGVEQFRHVRQVGHVADSVSEDGQFAVHDANRSHLERPETQLVAFLQFVQFQLRNARIGVPNQAIGQPLPQVLAGVIVGIEGQVVLEGKGAKVVNASDMVVVLVSPSSKRAEARRRRSRGSLLVQTSHWQPICGTPMLVPVPRKVIFILPVFHLPFAIYHLPFNSSRSS